MLSFNHRHHRRRTLLSSCGWSSLSTLCKDIIQTCADSMYAVATHLVIGRGHQLSSLGSKGLGSVINADIHTHKLCPLLATALQCFATASEILTHKDRPGAHFLQRQQPTGSMQHSDLERPSGYPPLSQGMKCVHGSVERLVRKVRHSPTTTTTTTTTTKEQS
jgi:hypothetical protein